MSDQPSVTPESQPPVAPPPFPNQAAPAPSAPPPFPVATQVPAPPAAPPVAPATSAPAPGPAPKKKRGCLITLIVLGVIVLALVGTAFAVISAAGKPRDLGVRYTLADYHRAAAKVHLAEFAPAAGGGSTGSGTGASTGSSTSGSKSGSKSGSTSGSKSGSKSGSGSKPGTSGSKGNGSGSGSSQASTAGDNADGTGFTDTVTYSGSQPIDAVLTSAEISALLNYSHVPGWPISQAQVLLTGDHGFMASFFFEYAGTKYPVFAEGTVGISGGTLSGIATSAQVLGWTVPQQYLGPGSEYVVGVINQRLSRLGTLNITDATIVDGGVHLVGTGPAEAQPSGQ